MEVWLTSGLSRFLLPRNQQKRVTILAGEIRPDPQEKVGLLLDSEHREDCSALSHPVAMVHGQVYQPWLRKCMVTRNKGLGRHTRQVPRLAEIPVESERN